MPVRICSRFVPANWLIPNGFACCAYYLRKRDDVKAGIRLGMLKQAHVKKEALIHFFDETIGVVNPFAVDEAVEDARSLHGSEGFHGRVENFWGEGVNECAVTVACAPESGEDVFGDVGLAFDLEACFGDVAIELRDIGRRAEIGVEEMPAVAKDTIHGLEEFILMRIAVRGFHVKNGIEMILRKIECLRIACAKIYVKRIVGFAAVFNGFGVLVDGGVGLRFVITPDKRCAATVPATDLEYVFTGKFRSAGNVVIELNGGAIGLVFRLECDSFTFRRPVTVIQKCDRVATNTSAEVLVPDLPENLFDGGHVRLHLFLKF